ncbi:Crp/Fnr family transcriptional regulator, partial [Corynebacterium heidelbergense]
MTVEIEAIRDFLADVEPFRHLPPDQLAQLSRQIQIRYVRRGQTIVAANRPNDSVFVIRSGAIDVLDPDGLLLDRREAGRCFGYSTLVSDRDSLYTMLAVEDSLLLAVERPTFDALVQENPEVARYFSGLSARMRAHTASLQTQSSSDVLRTRLGDFRIL